MASLQKLYVVMKETWNLIVFTKLCEVVWVLCPFYIGVSTCSYSFPPSPPIIHPSPTPLQPPHCRKRKKVRWKAARKPTHSNEPFISSWLPGRWDSSEAIFVGRSLCQLGLLIFLFMDKYYSFTSVKFILLWFCYISKLRFWSWVYRRISMN